MVKSKQKIVNFQHAKNAQEGIITPEMLRESMDNWIDDAEINHLVVIYVCNVPDDDNAQEIEVAHTNMTKLELMGLMDWAKQIIEHGDEE